MLFTHWLRQLVQPTMTIDDVYDAVVACEKDGTNTSLGIIKYLDNRKGGLRFRFKIRSHVNLYLVQLTEEGSLRTEVREHRKPWPSFWRPDSMPWQEYWYFSTSTGRKQKTKQTQGSIGWAPAHT